MALKRAIFDQITYTTDAPTVVDRTFVTLPLAKATSTGVVRPRETPEVTTMINGNEAVAHVSNRFVIPFSIEPGDTFLDPLITASCDATPVWFRFLLCGQTQGDEVGGSRGCSVVVSSGVAPDFGDLTVSTLGGHTVACCAGETLSTFTLGS